MKGWEIPFLFCTLGSASLSPLEQGVIPSLGTSPSNVGARYRVLASLRGAHLHCKRGDRGVPDTMKGKGELLIK